MGSSSNDYMGPPARKKFAVDGIGASASMAVSGDSSGVGSTTTTAEIAAGARRLANELKEFIAAQQEQYGGPSNNPFFTTFNFSSSSEENIVDLQLVTCRKLREVRDLMVSPYLLQLKRDQHFT